MTDRFHHKFKPDSGVDTLREGVLAIKPSCLVLIPFVVAIAVCGCGGSNKTGRVSGSVTFDGAPLAEGFIVFHPVEGRPARGEIQNGEIVDVTTLEPGDGAPLGDVKIAIQAFKPDPNDPAGMNRISLIPDKYGNSDTSGLTATITSGNNVLKFDLMP